MKSVIKVKVKDIGHAFLLKDELRLPFLLETQCPNCKLDIYHDLEYDDLMFRIKLNEPDWVSLWCQDCDQEISVDVKLSIQLEVL